MNMSKTVYEITKEYKDKINGNVTPIFGFKVGDMVKQSPKKPTIGITTQGGRVVWVNGHRVTFELKPGSYDTETMHELWLMPAEE